MKKILFFIFSTMVVVNGCNSQNNKEENWSKKLTKEEFHILREKGTERAFTGKYWNNKKEGDYKCDGCGQKLFSSDKKFIASIFSFTNFPFRFKNNSKSLSRIFLGFLACLALGYKTPP